MTDLVERRLGWVTVDGQRYPAEKATDWLDAVKRGLCPFCGEGPFIVVAQHVWRRHGLRGAEMRDLLGIPLSESICDSAYSKHQAELLREKKAQGVIVNWGGQSGGQCRATMARNAAAKRSGETRRKKAEAEAAVRLYLEEDLPTSEVARRVGISASTVRRALRQAGVAADDAYARYARLHLQEILERGSVAREKHQEVRRAQRVDLLRRHLAGEPIAQLAASEGIRESSMRNRLRRAKREAQ